jgi:hypothetical protein
MAKKQLTRKLVSVEEKEAALEALEQKRVVEKPITKAPIVAIALPMDLYQDIKIHIDHSGQTLKGFLCMCAKEYLKNKK